MFRARSAVLSRVARALALLAVAVLGIALRLNNLSSESVYWDEFSSLIHLRPPAGYEIAPDFEEWERRVIREESTSLTQFWKANRNLDPATMPLYYSLEYYVWDWCGQSVPRLRLLSVFFSVLAFPLFYLLGRALWGPWAGLTALFLFAASPVHVLFAQEIRMYSLFGFLAIASAYTFYRVVEQGRWWWAPHLLVNLLLFWTHPFAVWLPFTEGLFLVFFHWPNFRFVLTWGFAHVGLLIPTAIYVSQIKFYGEDTTSAWMVLPGWEALVKDIFADDFVGMTAQLWGRPDFFLRLFSAETAHALAEGKEYYGFWCAVFLSTLCLFGVMAQFIRAATGGEAAASGRWKWAAFLVMWALLPPLILILLSQVWRPMIMPRYTMHCAFAFYLLAGGGIAALRWNALRVPVFAMLILIYAYQQGLVLEGPHRTNWNGVAQFLKSKAQTDDLILSDNWLWKRVFTYTLGPVPQAVSYGTSTDTVALQARVWLDSTYPQAQNNTASRGVWLVVNNGYFSKHPAAALEETLTARGMTWNRTFFTGLEGIWVYEVLDSPTTPHQSFAGWQPHSGISADFQDLVLVLWRRGDFATGACVAQEALTLAPTESRLWSYMGMNLMDLGETRAALDAFKQAAALGEREYPPTLTNMGACYLELRRPALAVPVLEKAIALEPKDPRTRTLLARGYIAQERPWLAVELLQNALDTQFAEEEHWRVLQLAQQEWGRLNKRAGE